MRSCRARSYIVAKATVTSSLQDQIRKTVDFLKYLVTFWNKKKPIQTCINNSIEYVKELLSLKEKQKKLSQRINYEKYKLKKTELILAQNSEHVFLRGKSINQIR